MKSILVTGGSGFIGYHLIKKLSYYKNTKIYIIDNLSRGKKDEAFKAVLKKKNIIFINHDLTKPFNKKIKNIEIIFHLAAIVGVQNVINKPYRVLIENIKMLENILNFASMQKKLRKFIFLSTSEIYGSSLENQLLKFPTDESSIISIFNPPNARGSYMLSKIYGEAMCILSKIPSIIIRPHNIYGPRMGYSHVIPEIIDNMNSRKKIIKIFNPSHKRCFCYIDDAVSFLVRLSKVRLKNNFLTLNLGNNSEEINIRDLAIKINFYFNKKIKFRKLDIGSPKKRFPCLKKIISLTKFKPKINLEEGIKKTLSWYRFEKRN